MEQLVKDLEMLPESLCMIGGVRAYLDDGYGARLFDPELMCWLVKVDLKERVLKKEVEKKRGPRYLNKKRSFADTVWKTTACAISVAPHKQLTYTDGRCTRKGIMYVSMLLRTNALCANKDLRSGNWT